MYRSRKHKKFVVSGAFDELHTTWSRYTWVTRLSKAIFVFVIVF